MTTAFDRWVSETIQDMGGDGAKYLRDHGSNVVSLTDWKNFRHNLPRQVLVPHDEHEPSNSCVSAERQGGTSTGTQQFEGFCVSGRPKHDSELPQVGQNFKEPRHGSQQWQGAIPTVRGASRITKPGELETTMVIRTRGVNPSSAQSG